MLASFPPAISQQGWALALKSIQYRFLPFSDIGMDWVIPTVLGLAIGFVGHFYHKAKLQDA